MTLVSSCDDPNELGWRKIEDNSSSVMYLDSTAVLQSGPVRSIKIRSDSKDGYSNTTYFGQIICDSGEFYYSKSHTIYKDENGLTKEIYNDFSENPKALRLTLRGDDVLKKAACWNN
jgi:hypothetical protein